MPINYSVDGTQSANFHYKCRLISNTFNKLFYNILSKGIIPESGTPTIVNTNGIEGAGEGVKVKIPSGFSLLISPNNRYSQEQVIRNNFFALTETNQEILERQVLKCDIVKDFYVSPTTMASGWLVAEYNYLEFPELAVDFSIVSDIPTDNRVIIAEITVSGSYISAISFANQKKAILNPEIYYEMNLDTLNGYHAGNSSGYIPVSNGIMCQGLNTEMVNGYSGYEAALKWDMSSGLNAEFMGDEFGEAHTAGTLKNNVPVSLGTGVTNANLNTELLGGEKYTTLAWSNHKHWLSDIVDGPNVNRPVNVNALNHLTSASFLEGAFTLPKIEGECFFAYNDADDTGGRLRIVSGEELVTKNLHVIDFVKSNNNVFSKKPQIMIQILDNDEGTYDGYYIKMMACNITYSKFEISYTIYKADDGNNYVEQPIEDIWIHWVAWGYTDDDTWGL